MNVLSYIYMHTHVHRHGRIYIYIHILFDLFWGFGIFAYITTFYIDLPELSRTNVFCELGIGEFPIHLVYIHTWAPAFHHIVDTSNKLKGFSCQCGLNPRIPFMKQ